MSSSLVAQGYVSELAQTKTIGSPDAKLCNVRSFEIVLEGDDAKSNERSTGVADCTL
jgi:hypothetical protein